MRRGDLATVLGMVAADALLYVAPNVQKVFYDHSVDPVWMGAFDADVTIPLTQCNENLLGLVTEGGKAGEHIRIEIESTFRFGVREIVFPRAECFQVDHDRAAASGRLRVHAWFDEAHHAFTTVVDKEAA
jgi:hypothetical protein